VPPIILDVDDVVQQINRTGHHTEGQAGSGRTQPGFRLKSEAEQGAGEHNEIFGLLPGTRRLDQG
jgi:hypothetical protein